MPCPLDECHNTRQPFARLPVPGDGDCLFHAFSVSANAMGIRCGKGPQLREMVIQELEEMTHWRGRFFFRSDRLAYIKALRDGAWGDSLCLEVLARRREVGVTIHCPIGEVIQSFGRGERVHVLFNGCNHYDAVFVECETTMDAEASIGDHGGQSGEAKHLTRSVLPACAPPVKEGATTEDALSCGHVDLQASADGGCFRCP